MRIKKALSVIYIKLRGFFGFALASAAESFKEFKASPKEFFRNLFFGPNTKSKAYLDKVSSFPTTIGEKKVKPKVMAVVTDNCTGCGACIPACPVDCISWLPQETKLDKYSTDWRPIQPVQIRFQECIGCNKCAQVCAYAAWDAIKMIPTANFESETGIKVEAKIPKNPPPVFQINTEWTYKYPTFEV